MAQSQLNKYKDLLTCHRIAGHCQAITGTISAQQVQRRVPVKTNMSSHRRSLSGHHWHNLSSTSTKTCTGERITGHCQAMNDEGLFVNKYFPRPSYRARNVSRARNVRRARKNDCPQLPPKKIKART